VEGEPVKIHKLKNYRLKIYM